MKGIGKDNLLTIAECTYKVSNPIDDSRMTRFQSPLSVEDYTILLETLVILEATAYSENMVKNRIKK